MAIIRIDWHPEVKVLRTFGWSLAATGVLLGISSYVFGWLSIGNLVLLTATICVCGLITLVAPRAAVSVWIYRFWSVPALLVGSVMSVIVVSAVFYTVVTPIGLFMRAIGHDLLLLRGDRESFWNDIERNSTDEDFQRQF